MLGPHTGLQEGFLSLHGTIGRRSLFYRSRGLRLARSVDTLLDISRALFGLIVCALFLGAFAALTIGTIGLVLRIVFHMSIVLAPI